MIKSISFFQGEILQNIIEEKGLKMPPRALTLPGKCPICRAYEHKSPGYMSERQIFNHRITEDRDCPSYEECLTAAALEDAAMVPCIYCERYREMGRK